MKKLYRTLALLCCVFLYDYTNAQVNFDTEKYKSVLYRVNAGGVFSTISDGTGVNWAEDSYTIPCGCSNSANTGNKVYTTDDVITFDSSVPDDYPQSLFQEERSIEGWDPKRMEWNFPVDSGLVVEVRVFMAEIFHNSIDERHFAIEIDGNRVEEDIDLFKDYGHDVGIMKTYRIVTDENIDLSFITIEGQPTVAAIEIMELNDVTSTTRLLDGKESNIFPNPFKNLVNIRKESISPDEKIILYTSVGQEVNNYSIIENNRFYQLNMSNLPQGFYFLKLGSSGYIIEKQ